MGQSLTHKIIAAHLLDGEMIPGHDILLAGERLRKSRSALRHA